VPLFMGSPQRNLLFYRISDGFILLERSEMTTIDLIVEPGTVLSWKQFSATKPPYSIALDGYVSGPTRYTPHGPFANFNHHEDVDRMATRSTCAQIFFAMMMGLFDAFQREGEAVAHVWVNDADQDVCLSYWLLKNPEITRSIAWEDPMAKLIILEDFVDASAGAYPIRNLHDELIRQQAWVFEPYTTARSQRRLHAMAGSDLVGIIEKICDRLTRFAEGKSRAIDLDTRHEVIGGGPGWKMVIETGIYARTELYSSGTKVFVGMRKRDDGRYTYIIGKMSPYILFPLTRIYTALNRNDTTISEGNAWGGSDIIGGSPRKTGSSLSPDRVEAIINRTISKEDSA